MNTAPSPTLSPPLAEQLCTCCWTFQPASHFARRRKGDEARSHRCKGCKSAQERARYRRKQGKRIGRLMSRLAREKDGGRLEMLVAATMAEFKSPDDFVAEWVRHIRAAMEGEPGSRRALVAFQAVAGMMREVGEREQAGKTGESAERWE